MKIRFTVYGKPIAQPRPRRAWQGHFYSNPEKLEQWKYNVGWEAKALKHPLLDGALAMKAIFYLPKPKSTSRKVKYPIVRPDGDNFEKPIMDALEKICYKNDSQIVDGHWLKVYCSKDDGEKPRVEIEIAELEH